MGAAGGSSVNHICVDTNPIIKQGNTDARVTRLTHIQFSGCPSRSSTLCNQYHTLQKLPCVVCSVRFRQGSLSRSFSRMLTVF